MKKLIYRILFFLAIYKIGYYVGSFSTVNELKEFMSKILDIHGQHDSQLILNPMQHIIYLDKFIGKELEDNLNKYKVKLAEYNTLKQELKNTYGEDQEKERRLDLLRYQYNEIEQANLKEKAYAKMKASGAHYVIDSIADLPAVLDAIEQRLANGEKP